MSLRLDSSLPELLWSIIWLALVELPCDERDSNGKTPHLGCSGGVYLISSSDTDW